MAGGARGDPGQLVVRTPVPNFPVNEGPLVVRTPAPIFSVVRMQEHMGPSFHVRCLRTQDGRLFLCAAGAGQGAGEALGIQPPLPGEQTMREDEQTRLCFMQTLFQGMGMLIWQSGPCA